MLLDGLSVFTSLLLATYIRPFLNQFAWIEPIPIQIVIPSSLHIFFPFIWVGIYSVLSIYDGRKYLSSMDEFSALTLAMVIASVSAAGVLYLSYRDISRALFIVFILLVYLICLVWRFVISIFSRTQSSIIAKERRVLVVGAGPLGQKIRNQLLGLKTSEFNFIGFVEEDEQITATSQGTFFGNINSIGTAISKANITDVVIALPHSDYSQMGMIVQSIEDTPVQVWVALGFFDLALYKTNIEDFAGIPMLDLRASAIDDYQRMLKRAFDIFGGMIALILAFPFMTLSAIAIFLEDGFPVLFKQKRAGENGRIFEMLKFRTMIKSAERLQSLVEKRDSAGNIIHKTKDDSRITRVGRILRRLSFDELPQFINVIRGDMSLVGPRPELPYLVEQYQPWQRKRFAIPPGITGWWQVSGRSDRPMHLHTEDDLYYIQNYSIFLDIQILIKTIWVVLAGKGSY